MQANIASTSVPGRIVRVRAEWLVTGRKGHLLVRAAVSRRPSLVAHRRVERPTRVNNKPRSSVELGRGVPALQRRDGRVRNFQEGQSVLLTERNDEA